MGTSIVVEELTLKPIADNGEAPPPAFYVIVDGERSSLYFTRREANEAVAVALELSAD